MYILFQGVECLSFSSWKWLPDSFSGSGHSIIHMEEDWSGSWTRWHGIFQIWVGSEKQTALCSLWCQEPSTWSWKTQKTWLKTSIIWICWHLELWGTIVKWFESHLTSKYNRELSGCSKGNMAAIPWRQGGPWAPLVGRRMEILGGCAGGALNPVYTEENPVTVTEASMWPPPQGPRLTSASAQPGVSPFSAYHSYSCLPGAEPHWEDSVWAESRECPVHRYACSVSRLLTLDSNEKSIDCWIEMCPLLEHVVKYLSWILVFLCICYKSMNIKTLIFKIIIQF